MSESIPNLIHADRNCRNGHVPSSAFYAAAITAENFITGYCDRSVLSKAWLLGNSSYGYTGATTVARQRFRTRYGAKYLRIAAVILKSVGGGSTPDPDIDVVVTEVGVGADTYTLSGAAEIVAGDDKPEDWYVALKAVPVTANAVYTIDVVLNDYARLASIEIHEVGDPTISEATDYYNGLVPAAGTPIVDTLHERLVEGLSDMYRHNGGTICHFSKIDGTATTRTSATAINLIDNATTGAPTAATPGWYLDMSYRCTQSRPTSVPFELSVYGSIGAGSGTVTLLNSAGTTLATVTINGAAGWYTATGTMSTTAGKFDLQLTGNGVNEVSVYAVSFQEWES